MDLIFKIWQVSLKAIREGTPRNPSTLYLGYGLILSPSGLPVEGHDLILSKLQPESDCRQVRFYFRRSGFPQVQNIGDKTWESIAF